MIYRVAADFVVGLHAGFVVFVVFGGLLGLRWPRAAWLHVPAAAWGVFIEFAGWICPLTPLENSLRERSGLSTYQGDFVERYLMPLLYPADLTRHIQFVLGGFALLFNVVVYTAIWRRRFVGRRRSRSSEDVALMNQCDPKGRG